MRIIYEKSRVDQIFSILKEIGDKMTVDEIEDDKSRVNINPIIEQSIKNELFKN